MDEVSEVSDSLMERYLEGEEISHEEIVEALKEGTNHGRIFPVVCGVATRNLGHDAAARRDRRGPPLAGQARRPAGRRGRARAAEDRELFAYVFKTRADPFAGRINLMRVYQGVVRARQPGPQHPRPVKERIGQLIVFDGKGRRTSSEFGPGDIGAVAKLKETRAGDWLAERDEPIEMPPQQAARPVMAFAIEPKSKGDEDKVLHRPAAPAGGGPDDRPAPRPPDRASRSSPGSPRSTWR